MCEVSKKLKLCTCSKEKYNTLKNYWILYRFVEGKSIWIIGDPVMPLILRQEVNLGNKTLLIGLLNDSNVFDFPYRPKNDDLLELAFQIGEAHQRIVYGFRNIHEKWHHEDYDPFGWLHYHEKRKWGEIKNGMEKVDRSQILFPFLR